MHIKNKNSSSSHCHTLPYITIGDV